MNRQLSLFLAGLVIGGLIGGGFVYVTTPPETEVSVPSMTSTAATGCADSNETRAWVGQTGALDYRSIEFQNYSFTHENPNIGVRSNLTEQADGRWVLAFTTHTETPTKPANATCPPRTTVSASVALPTDFETVTIRLDDETLTTVRNSGNRPHFYYLNNTEEV